MDQNKAEEDRIDYPFAYGFLESKIKAIVKRELDPDVFTIGNHTKVSELITEAIEEARQEGKDHYKRYGK